MNLEIILLVCCGYCKRSGRPAIGSIKTYKLPLGVAVMDILVICQSNGILIGLTTITLIQSIIGRFSFCINIIKAYCTIVVVFIEVELTSLIVGCSFVYQRNTSACIVVRCTTTMTYVFPRTIVDNIVILSTIISTSIQEIPQHIITKYIIGRNGVICLGGHIETLKSIGLNQIEFLLGCFNSPAAIIICGYFNWSLRPRLRGPDGQQHRQEKYRLDV